MVDLLKKNQCCGCERCASVCPAGAIKMVMDKEGFRYPVIDHDKCIGCNECDKCCVYNNYEIPRCGLKKAYACRNSDETVRSVSTSGGVYTPIAINIIKKLGVVYGVKFDENWSVVFDRAEDIEGAMKFRLSKYPQALVGDIYRSVEEDLKSDKKVLFTGTPCQVAALKFNLSLDYDNLYTMDFICLGIASPGIWEWYLDNVHERKSITAINFKSKICGWKDWHILIEENGKKTWESNKENHFMHDFCIGINTRPSCFSCPFKGIDHVSDFTVSDCWGLGEKLRINDNKGLSALLIHSKKGFDLFQEVRNNFILEEHDPNELMKDNRATFGHLYENSARKKFFEKEEWKRWVWSGKEY